MKFNYFFDLHYLNHTFQEIDGFLPTIVLSAQGEVLKE